MIKNIFPDFIRYLLIVLWVYAVLAKLDDYSAFTDQLKRQPLPGFSIYPLSVLIPISEICAVCLLCFRRTVAKGYLLSSILLFVFTLYVGLGLAHVYGKVPCSCGGILEKTGWSGHLVFNIFFLLLSLSGLLLQKSKHPLLSKSYVTRHTEKYGAKNY